MAHWRSYRAFSILAAGCLRCLRRSTRLTIELLAAVGEAYKQSVTTEAHIWRTSKAGVAVLWYR